MQALLEECYFKIEGNMICTKCHQEDAEWIFGDDEAYCQMCWEAHCDETWWESCAPSGRNVSEGGCRPLVSLGAGGIRLGICHW